MKISKILLNAALATVVLVVVTELLLRLFSAQPIEPKRRYILENDIDGLVPKVVFEFDGNQVRGFDSMSPKPDGALRILCVGGGMSGTMLQKESDTWWGALGEKLEKSLGREIQIGSIVQQGGSMTIPSAQWVDRVLGEIDGVDLVIGMFGHSDLIHPRIDYVFDPAAIPPIAPPKSRSLPFKIARVSHLARIVRNAYIRSRRNEQQAQLGKANAVRDRLRAFAQLYRSTAATTAGPMRASDPIAGYLHGIEMFGELARTHQTKVLIVGEPTVFSVAPSAEVGEMLHSIIHVGPGDSDYARPLPDWVDSELKRYYEAAGSVCAKAGIKMANLHGEIPPTRANFYTEASLTDAGAERAAELLVAPVAAAIQ